ncbi:TIGR03086 family protein [Streptomyces lunaelactis]|uniref:TIGR03086 family protein n=1 Tax=Streptomyces lunaelactis TaxID=1535768 RepID=A0A2R4T573_9ACTN|nr:TIGR03086 family metal-binding protein [Streptomyces lunaelactis]AVZ74241.1 TIGR03086 family protein [Streptomyces lunaelactis]NUK85223.1 TIGR03086 family protein [Streptomyces lunaelactis]
MSNTPVTAFTDIVDTVAHLVETVADDQWTAPTPCSEWNVQQLVDHLVTGQGVFIGVMAEQSTSEGSEQPDGTEPTPASLKAAFRESAGALVTAFAQPGALERTVQAPIGAVPGAVALHLQTIEHLVHGFDLAQATGRKALFDDTAVERETEFARGLVAQLPPAPDGPFAQSRTAPADAPTIDHLAALLGREITG